MRPVTRPMATTAASAAKKITTPEKKPPNIVATAGKRAPLARAPASQKNVLKPAPTPAAVAQIPPASKPAILEPQAVPQVAPGNGKSDGHANEKTSIALQKPGEKAQGNAGNIVKPVEEKKTGGNSEAGGIVMLPITGDLKLEVKGDTHVKIAFIFREYPKNRRNRPMSKADSKRQKTVEHRLSNTREGTLAAVVETANDGIYDIVVEPANGMPVSASFSVKLYEHSTREKTRSLGTRVIKERSTIARILMPDGIYWDDDKYFSGYLEDSESITKYNSDNGLVWKEFKSPGD